MALTNPDRRRFFVATTVTLLALPALWLTNRAENSAAPNVAVAGAGVGVDVGADPANGTARGDVAGDTTPPDADATALSAGAAADDAGDDGTSTAAAAAAATGAATAADGSSSAAAGDAASDEPGAVPPVFLHGPTGQVGAGLAEIAVPARPSVERVEAEATFRHNLGARDGCAVPGVLNGRAVTIVNLDNGRSVVCTTIVQPGQIGDQVVIATDLFAQLADLTDAPIPVEIRR